MIVVSRRPVYVGCVSVGCHRSEPGEQWAHREREAQLGDRPSVHLMFRRLGANGEATGHQGEGGG
jgi:hypothetical protein